MSTESLAESPAAQRAGYDSDTPAALEAFMAGGWLERDPELRPHPQLERHRARRAALSRAYRGAYVLIPAGRERVRANDTYFRFRPSSDFAYLMGDGEPDALLVLEPQGAGHRTLLFVREHNRGTREFFTDRAVGELWVGRHRGVEESASYYGVDDCRPLARSRRISRSGARRAGRSRAGARRRRSGRRGVGTKRPRCENSRRISPRCAW